VAAPGGTLSSCRTGSSFTVSFCLSGINNLLERKPIKSVAMAEIRQCTPVFDGFGQYFVISQAKAGLSRASGLQWLVIILANHSHDAGYQIGQDFQNLTYLSLARDAATKSDKSAG
jgi:hypothetical protein